jgi:thiamine biosynthesis lipoprotein ApbE
MTTTLLGIADGQALGGSRRVIVTRLSALAAAGAAVDRVVADIDAAASRFRDDSELSRLNAAPETDVVLSPLLAQAIGVALRAAELTGGAVDPTIGSALRLAGYDADFREVPPDGGEIRLVAETVPGWTAIRFDAGTRTVRLPRGVEIDLGATAKALASDLAAAAALKAAGGGGVLVSLGGDIAAAGEPPAEGWLVQASEDSAAPIDDSEETVSIRGGGIATSSTTVRRWKRGGRTLHHIIDPASGLPATSRWRTVTVVASTCVDANIASTASIVMGDSAAAWLEARHLAARLVDRDGRVTRLPGWPEPRRSPDLKVIPTNL